MIMSPIIRYQHWEGLNYSLLKLLVYNCNICYLKWSFKRDSNKALPSTKHCITLPLATISSVVVREPLPNLTSWAVVSRLAVSPSLIATGESSSGKKRLERDADHPHPSNINI